MSYDGSWRPYVPVAKRRARAQKKMAALRKKGTDIQPIEIEGRKIARSFWGEAWCGHLESFSDYDNRLPRGRTYVRNGSVCHLAIKKGKVEAKVAGSEIYEVRVRIETLSKRKWNAVKERCSGQIGSLLELLQGNLSDNIMSVVTNRKEGLFPKPAEIGFNCDCPDWANMCKHVAAALYGVGTRLDDDPSLLFRLRGVNHEELIDAQVAIPAGTGKGKSKRLSADSLSDVFGIDLDSGTDSAASNQNQPASLRKQKVTSKKTVKKKATIKKSAKKATIKKSAKKATNKKSVKKVTAKKSAKKKTAVKKTNSASRRPSQTKASPRKVTQKAAK
jgi:uncharacterized Zn finger protein